MSCPYAFPQTNGDWVRAPFKWPLADSRSHQRIENALVAGHEEPLVCAFSLKVGHGGNVVAGHPAAGGVVSRSSELVLKLQGKHCRAFLRLEDLEQTIDHVMRAIGERRHPGFGKYQHERHLLEHLTAPFLRIGHHKAVPVTFR